MMQKQPHITYMSSQKDRPQKLNSDLVMNNICDNPHSRATEPSYQNKINISMHYK